MANAELMPNIVSTSKCPSLFNFAKNGINGEVIESAKVEQLDKVNTPFAGFALRDE